MVFLALKRKNKEIYYFSDKHECDFVLRKFADIDEVIQVCFEINEDNREREIKGLTEAMQKFKLKEGLILTYDQEEEIKHEGKKISVKPVWKWLLDNE